MALFLWVANSLNDLQKHLTDQILATKWTVLQPIHIVTQTDGMNIWLKQSIANTAGIAANYAFDKPNDIIFLIYQILNGARQETFNRENLTWLLFEILNSASFKNRYPFQAKYFDVPDKEEAQLKRLKLAEKLADLFDQYQIYRQDTLLSWSANSLEDAVHWQAYLWKAIQIRTQHLIWSDKNQISQFVLQQLKDKSYHDAIKNALPVVYIFGLSVFTKYHLEIWFALSEIIDIQFYLLNPAPEIYWGDDRNERDILKWHNKGINTTAINIGNDLLTSWGKLLQQTFQMLFAYEPAMNAYEIVGEKKERPPTLLGTIQQEIEENIISINRASINNELLHDQSIVITAHFTILREVETLYQHILHQLKSATLGMREVIVMVSDIDAYAPYIKAVFDNAIIPLKYRIADESNVNIFELFQLVEQLINLDTNHFSNEAVIDLLSFSIIKERFGIYNIELIKQTIKAANIINGIKGDMDTETYLVSWEYGINRIIYGICMSDEPTLSIGDIEFLPIDMIEGGKINEIMAFCDFVKIIIEFLKKRNGLKTPLAWVLFLEYYFQLLFDAAYRESDEASIALQHILDQYKTAVEIIEDKISFDVFKTQFQTVLSYETRNAGFLSSGITFSSMVPMRSIPFKMVCILGMNYDKFPRKDKILSFNIMQHEKMLGDRNIKESDYHLFLETLLSCEENLYISYLGKSIKDNTIIPPSILVDELLKYIQLKAPKGTDVADILITCHPLYDSSIKYNQAANPNLFKYSLAEKSVEQNVISPVTDQDIIYESANLSSKTLIQFITHPIKYYFNKRLQIYYNDENKVLFADHEPFEIAFADQLAIKKSYLLNEITVFEKATKIWKLKGLLPLKNMADYTLETIINEVAPYKAQLIAAVDLNEMYSIEKTYIVEGQEIDIRFEYVYNKKWFNFINQQNINNRQKIEIYYYLILGKLTDSVTEATLILPNETNNLKVLHIDNINLTECKLIISNVLKWMKKGFHTFIPYFHKFNEIKMLQTPPFTLMEELLSNYNYPLQDPYIIQVHKEGALNYDELQYSTFIKECILPVFEWYKLFENEPNE